MKSGKDGKDKDNNEAYAGADSEDLSGVTSSSEEEIQQPVQPQPDVEFHELPSAFTKSFVLTTDEEIREKIFKQLAEEKFEPTGAGGQGIAGEVVIMKYTGDNEIYKKTASGKKLAIKLPGSRVWDIYSNKEVNENIYRYGYSGLGRMQDVINNNEKQDPGKIYVDFPGGDAYSQGIEFLFVDADGVNRFGVMSGDILRRYNEKINISWAYDDKTSEEDKAKILKGVLSILHIKKSDVKYQMGNDFLSLNDKNALQTYENESKVILELEKKERLPLLRPRVGLIRTSENMPPIVMNECIYSDKEMTRTSTINKHMVHFGNNCHREKRSINVIGVLQISRPMRSAREAIIQVHNDGYVHGDAAGRNFMMTENGSAKIIDFGTGVKVPETGETLHEIFYNTPVVLYNQASVNKSLGTTPETKNKSYRHYSFQTDLFSFRVLNAQSMMLMLGVLDNGTVDSRLIAAFGVTKDMKGDAYFTNLAKNDDNTKLQLAHDDIAECSKENSHMPNAAAKNKFVNHYLETYGSYLYQFSEEKNPLVFEKNDTEAYYACSAKEILIALDDLHASMNDFTAHEINMMLDEARQRASKCQECGLDAEAWKILKSPGYLACVARKNLVEKVAGLVIDEISELKNQSGKGELDEYLNVISDANACVENCKGFDLDQLAKEVRSGLKEGVIEPAVKLMTLKIDEAVKNGDEKQIVQVRQQVVKLAEDLQKLDYPKSRKTLKKSPGYVELGTLARDIKKKQALISKQEKKSEIEKRKSATEKLGGRDKTRTGQKVEHSKQGEAKPEVSKEKVENTRPGLTKK